MPLAQHPTRLGLKTLGCYALFTTSAILIGLFFVTVMKPGFIDGAPAGDQLNLPLSAAQETTLETIGQREGQYKGMVDKRKFRVHFIKPGVSTSATMDSADKEVTYEGKEISVKL